MPFPCTLKFDPGVILLFSIELINTHNHTHNYPLDLLYEAHFQSYADITIRFIKIKNILKNRASLHNFSKLFGITILPSYDFGCKAPKSLRNQC